MDKKYQIFVSSTYKDLKEERAGVISAILRLGCIPVAMEQFPAAPVSQWDYIKNMINESDYVVLIVAGCYRTEDKAERISFTEKEFNYSQSIGKPVLPFLVLNTENLMASKSESTDAKKEKLKLFRDKIENSGCLVNYYENVDDLKYKVATPVTAYIKSNPGIGWVRADQVELLAKKMANELGKEIDVEKLIPQYQIISKEDIKKIFTE